MSSQLFAYGTLMPTDAATVASQGWMSDAVRGRLFDLGPYPGLTDLDAPCAGWAEGYVRAVEPQELDAFDRWEDVDGGTYRRVETMTRNGLRLGFMYMLGLCRPRCAGRCRGGESPCSLRNRILHLPIRENQMTANARQTASREGSTSTSSNGPAASSPALPTTIGQYLVERLEALGVEHVFGIPGDYILQLYKLIDESPIKLVGVTREDNAGFRGRRVRADSRTGLHLRDVLRGGALDLQQHCRSICRKVAGDRAGGLAGDVGTSAQSALAPQGQGIRDAVRGLPEDHGCLGGAGPARDCVQRDRSGAGSGGPVQASGLSRAAARPDGCAASRAAPAAGRAPSQRPRCPARGDRRGGRAL